MKQYILYSFFLFSALVVSCNKEIKSKKGSIDLVSNVYINASKGLDNMQSFHISKINYSNDSIIELVPNVINPIITEDIYFIKDSLYYSLGSSENAKITTIMEVTKFDKPSLVYNEFKKGAVFSKSHIPNYYQKRDLKDTILFNKTYKRFEINSPENFSRYYVYETDTILPYSLYRHAELDYKGRIERIDTYNKKQDVFVTLQLIPKKNWDEEARDIFKFNDFINKKNKK